MIYKDKYLFNYFISTLNNLKISKIEIKLILILSFSQNISIIILNSFNLNKNQNYGAIASIIRQINSFLNVSWWINRLEISKFISIIRLIFNGYFIIIYIMIITWFLKLKNIRLVKEFENENLFLIKFWKKYHPYIYLVFIQYTIQLYLPSLLCSHFSFTQYWNNKEQVYNCGKFFNIKYLAIIWSLIQIIINIIYSIIISLLISDSINHKANKFSKLNNNLDLWILLDKIYLLVWNTFFINNPFFIFAYMFFYIFYSIHEFNLVLNNIFIDFDVNKFFIIIFLLEKLVFIVFNLTNLYTINILNYNINVIIVLFVFVFLTRLILNISDHIIDRNYNINLNDKNTNESKLWIIFYLISNYSEKIGNLPQSYLKNNKINFNLVKLIGLIKNHIKNCNWINCICNKVENNIDNNNIFNKVYLDKLLNQIIINFSHIKLNNNLSFNFYLWLIEHQIKNLKNPFKSLKYIYEINGKLLSIKNKFYLFKLKIKIISYFYSLKKSSQEKISINKMIDINNKYIDLKNIIENFLEEYLKIMKLMINRTVNLNLIESINYELYYLQIDIYTKFNLVKNYNKALILILNFEKIIQNKEKDNTNNKLIYKFFEKQRVISNINEIIYDEHKLIQQKIVVLVVGAINETKGLIYESYYKTKKLLGYETQEIEKMNITKLIPKEISEDHDKYLENSENYSDMKKYYKINNLYVLNKNKFIVPVFWLIKPYYNFFTDNIKNLVLIIEKEDESTVITNKNGKIIGITKSANKNNNWHISTYPLYIQYFIPKLFNFYRNIQINLYGMKGSKLKEILEKHCFWNKKYFNIHNNIYNKNENIITPYPEEILNYANIIKYEKDYKLLYKNYNKILKNIENKISKFDKIKAMINYNFEIISNDKIYLYFKFYDYNFEKSEIFVKSKKISNFFFLIIYLKLLCIRLKKKNYRRSKNNFRVKKLIESDSSSEEDNHSKLLKNSINSSNKVINLNIYLKDYLNKNFIPNRFYFLFSIIISFFLWNNGVLFYTNYLSLYYNRQEINSLNFKHYNILNFINLNENFLLLNEIIQNNTDNKQKINFNYNNIKNNLNKLSVIFGNGGNNQNHVNMFYNFNLKTEIFGKNIYSNFYNYILRNSLINLNIYLNSKFNLENYKQLNKYFENFSHIFNHNVHNFHWYIFIYIISGLFFINFLYLAFKIYFSWNLLTFWTNIYNLLISLSNNQIFEIISNINSLFFGYRKRVLRDNLHRWKTNAKITLYKKNFIEIKCRNIKKGLIIFFTWLLFIVILFVIIFFTQIYDNLKTNNNLNSFTLLKTAFNLNSWILYLDLKIANNYINEINKPINKYLKNWEDSLNNINKSENYNKYFYNKFIIQAFLKDNLCDPKIFNQLTPYTYKLLNCNKNINNIFKKGFLNSLYFSLSTMIKYNYILNNNIKLDKNNFKFIKEVVNYQNLYLKLIITNLNTYLVSNKRSENIIIIITFFIIFFVLSIYVLWEKTYSIQYFYSRIKVSKNIFNLIPINYIKKNNVIKNFLIKKYK